MVKISCFLTRREGTTHEEFLDYWTQEHTPMVASLPGGATGVHRYVQQYALPDDGITGIETSPYDGVAELWVDSIEDAEAWFAGETYTTTIAADEEHFLDRSKTRFLYSTEHPIFG